MGAVLLIAHLRGAFEDPARVRLYEAIQRGEEVSADSPRAEELLHEFGLQRSQVGAILRPEPTWERPRGDDVVALLSGGRRVRLADISEIRSWAGAESRIYEWAVVALVVTGTLIAVLLLVFPAPDPPSIL